MVLGKERIRNWEGRQQQQLKREGTNAQSCQSWTEEPVFTRLKKRGDPVCRKCWGGREGIEEKTELGEE